MSNIHFYTASLFTVSWISWVVLIKLVLLLKLCLHFSLNSHVGLHVNRCLLHDSEILHGLLLKLHREILSVLLFIKTRRTLLLLVNNHTLLWTYTFNFGTQKLSIFCLTIILRTVFNSFHSLRIGTFEWGGIKVILIL